MSTLISDLSSPQLSLADFSNLCLRVLKYLPDVISRVNESRGYKILISEHAGNIKFSRPIRMELFIDDPDAFETESRRLTHVLSKIKMNESVDETASATVDKVCYTIQQAMGVGLDLLGNPNSSRKHIRNRFEEFVRTLFTEAGFTNQKITFKIPYSTNGDDNKTYSCETDMILSNLSEIKSTQSHIQEGEIVVSLKTSSKDRMGKIFLDKMLMEKFSGHPVKVIGIFHNDVQRKNEDSVSFTFVSGLFKVYSEFLCSLEGVYFLDPPDSKADKISTFSDLLLTDLRTILRS